MKTFFRFQIFSHPLWNNASFQVKNGFLECHLRFSNPLHIFSLLTNFKMVLGPNFDFISKIGDVVQWDVCNSALMVFWCGKFPFSQNRLQKYWNLDWFLSLRIHKNDSHKRTPEILLFQNQFLFSLYYATRWIQAKLSQWIVFMVAVINWTVSGDAAQKEHFHESYKWNDVS